MNYFEPKTLDLIIRGLTGEGYTVIAPVLRGGAIVCDEVTSSSDLPAGWADEQDPARYRVRRRDDLQLFGYAAGPISWKKFFFPPQLKLLSAKRTAAGFAFTEHVPTRRPKYAFLGIHACDLAALLIQDRVFTGGTHIDSHYKTMREEAFIVAVNCTDAGGTCFCASMEAGPEATTGYDLVLTEVLDGGTHFFAGDAGSAKGEKFLAGIPHRPLGEGEMRAVRNGLDRAKRNMRKALDTANIRGVLYGNLEHPRWEEVGKRCLSCANCTLACPTCFCTTVEDTTDLTGEHAERWRKWDSCFGMEFSYIHGGSIRSSVRARYRQWMTHKLAGWIDQFGTSGCVGCGRCITWCPVGIDITEEAAELRKSGSQLHQAKHTSKEHLHGKS